MERFSMFTMANGHIVYIDTTKIAAVKDVRANNTEGKTIIYLSSDCGFAPCCVREDIDNVMYTIDTKENPEFYKVVGKPENTIINPDTKIGSVTLKDVLIQIRNVCKQIKDCNYCPFYDGNECVLHSSYPEHWEIENMQGSTEE